MNAQTARRSRTSRNTTADQAPQDAPVVHNDETTDIQPQSEGVTIIAPGITDGEETITTTSGIVPGNAEGVTAITFPASWVGDKDGQTTTRRATAAALRLAGYKNPEVGRILGTQGNAAGVLVVQALRALGRDDLVDSPGPRASGSRTKAQVIDPRATIQGLYDQARHELDRVDGMHTAAENEAESFALAMEAHGFALVPEADEQDDPIISLARREHARLVTRVGQVAETIATQRPALVTNVETWEAMLATMPAPDEADADEADQVEEEGEAA